MFVAPSPHSNGFPYEIMGTDTPSRITLSNAFEMVEHIRAICKKYDIEYAKEKRESELNDRRIKQMIKHLRIEKNSDYEIHEGSRNDTLFSIARSILYHHHGNNKLNIDKLKGFFEQINTKFCKPNALSQDEIGSIWKSALTYEPSYINPSCGTSNKILSFEKSVTVIEKATEEILTKYHFMTLEETKQIYHYQDGVYVPGGEIIIEKEIEQNYRYEIANKHIVEIKGHIMRKTYKKRKELDQDLNIINLKNGLYDSLRNKLLPHTPEYHSINQKPIKFDSHATPRLFIKFLKAVLYKEDIKTAIDAMAYSFHRDCPFEYFFKLFGYGSNGKSVYTGLLTALHDIRNVSNVPVSTLVNNRFALADLEFKDVNIDTEVSSITIKDTSILKKLTGGRRQPIRIERKNQHAYDAYIHSKLFFNTNAMSENIDQSDAYYRREIIIQFPNRFEGNSKDPLLLEKLTNEEELSGIFNMLMNNLRMILRRGDLYLNEKSIEELRLKTERATDPIRFFVEEAIAEDCIEIDWTFKSVLYDAYIKFCKKYRIAPKSIEAFGKELKKKKNYSDSRKGTKNERKTCWLGVRLNPQYLLDEQQQTIDMC